jgi:hypothetical protein
VAADAYWFGTAADLASHVFENKYGSEEFTGSDASFAISWRGRHPPAQGASDVYSVFVCWGIGSASEPALTISDFSETVSLNAFFVEGKIEHAAAETVYVLAALDGDFSRIAKVGDGVAGEFHGSASLGFPG